MLHICELLEKMPQIPSTVKDMRFCFTACKSLTQTQSIPESVESISYTFWDCTKITSLVLNCKYNNKKGGSPLPGREGYYFEHAFLGCTGLKEGSIKVANAYLADYKKGATNMDIKENCFIGQ